MTRLTKVGALIAVVLLVAATIGYLMMPGPKPDKLVVTKISNNLYAPDAPMFSKTITNPNAVQLVYGDLQALTKVHLTSGVQDCPPEEGIAYRLDFYSGSRLILSAEYGPTGCFDVQLSNGVERYDEGTKFDNDLAQALGVTSQQFVLGTSP